MRLGGGEGALKAWVNRGREVHDFKVVETEELGFPLLLNPL